MKKNLLKGLCFGASIAVLSFVGVANANLLISPLRVMIEGRERSGEVVLINSSDTINTYYIEWNQLIQNSDTGLYEQDIVKEDGEVNLQDFAVFTPRRITLNPDERQVVRIGIRRPAELPDGEYKSHIKFRAVSQEDLEGTAGEGSFNAAAMIMASYEVPVIYRVGNGDSGVSIDSLSFDVDPRTGLLNANVGLERSGLYSVLGGLEIYHQVEGEAEVLLKEFQNINLYPEIDSRVAKVPLGVTGLKPGKIRIVYRENEEGVANKNGVVLAEKTFPLAN